MGEKRETEIVETIATPVYSRWVLFLFAAYFVADSAPAPPSIVEQGAYCARAADCSACHTSKKESPFSGGLLFNISVGKVYSTNITPDSETGIGPYSFEQFENALRSGIARDGHRLFPAMPYTSYAKIARQDMSALYAFFMYGVAPVHQRNNPAKLNWLLGGRCGMSEWNALYLKKGEFVADSNKDKVWNRGAYLVQSLGHCGDCHSPHGALGNSLADKTGQSKKYLSGGLVDNWYSSPLDGEPVTGLAAWSENDIVGFLKTGRTGRVAAIGVMAEVIVNSTQNLADSDLVSVATYLKSLTPFEKDHSQHGCGRHTSSQVYMDNCNYCHASDGTGANNTIPNLVRNEAVNAENPASLIRIVLEGSRLPPRQSDTATLLMPALGEMLTDEKVANALTFVRSSWGNCAQPMSRWRVHRMRRTLHAQ
jgi:mono/diheme cytochrome c family protein